MGRRSRSPWALRGVLGTHIACVFSAGILLLLARSILEGTFLGDGEGAPDGALPLCEGWHKGSGGTDPIDLAEVRRAYRDLKARFDRGVAQAPKDLEAFLDRPHRTDLPACGAAGSRQERLKDGSPPGLAGRALYFATLDDPRAFRMPREVKDQEGCVILLLGAQKVADVGKLAEQVGRPVYLVGADFAKALHVRCAGTLVRVSEKGDAVELHEGL